MIFKPPSVLIQPDLTGSRDNINDALYDHLNTKNLEVVNKSKQVRHTNQNAGQNKIENAIDEKKIFDDKIRKFDADTETQNTKNEITTNLKTENNIHESSNSILVERKKRTGIFQNFRSKKVMSEINFENSKNENRSEEVNEKSRIKNSSTVIDKCSKIDQALFGEDNNEKDNDGDDNCEVKNKIVEIFLIHRYVS